MELDDGEIVPVPPDDSSDPKAQPDSNGSGYRIVDLGPGFATAINDDNAVAGARDEITEVKAPTGLHPIHTSTAYVWDLGKFTMLGKLASGMADPPSSYAFAINNEGAVVGASGTFDVSSDGLWLCDAFLYRDGRLRSLLGTPKQDTSGWIAFGTDRQGLGINGSGSVVGMDARHGFFMPAKGEPRELYALSRFSNAEENVAIATAINEQGVAVGASTVGDDSHGSVLHAVVWKNPQNGRETDLGTLGSYPHSIAMAINNSGVIAGYVSRPTPNPDEPGGFCAGCTLPRDPSENGDYQLPRNGQAIVWYRGVPRLLGVRSGARDSAALGMNNRQTVVGTSGGHAVLWNRDQIEDLNELLPRRSGWVLKEANAINDHGWIAGTGDFRGAAHGFVLMPNAPKGGG